MKRCILILIILFLLGFVSFPSHTALLSATDSSGKTLTLSRVPERIISLSPGNTEILFALGLGEKIVGDTSFCNYPPEALQKEKIGNVTEVDIEKIVSLQPDLILASSLTPPEGIERLRSLNLPVFVLSPETLDQVIQDVRTVAGLCGVEENGIKMADGMQKEADQIAQRVASLSEGQKPVVFYLVWHDPVWTAGSKTFINEFITQAGGINMAGDLTGFSTIDLEEILRRNPTIIVVPEGHGSEENLPFQFVKNDARLAPVQAVKDEQIFPVNADIVSRPGPRVMEALDIFSRIIHPEIFGAYQYHGKK